MRAFVTGASGFLGRALGARLTAGGWDVAGVDVVPDPGRGVVGGDITGPGRWQAAVAGAQLVAHTAAIVSNAKGLDAQWRVNVLGTRRALDAAVAAGAERFVLFSSVRAFGDRGFPDGVEESWPVRPDGNAYVDTKIAAEQVALQAHAAGEIAVTVVRPGDVYGPGSRPWTVLPVESIRAGRTVLPAGGEGVFSPVYVDDLIDGVVLAATRPQAAGQVYTLSGGAGVPCRVFFGHYATMLGVKPLRTLPTGVAVAGAAVVAATARLRRQETEITPATVRYLGRTGTYSIAKAREQLGFAPQVELAEGMRRTELWLRARGLL